MNDSSMWTILGGIIVGIISAIGAIRLKRTWDPKDRVELLFDKYENFSGQVEKDNERLRQLLEDAQTMIDNLQSTVAQLRSMLEARDEKIKELEEELRTLRTGSAP